MASLLSVSPAEQRLLPGQRFRGPAPFLIAIMTFVAIIISAAGLVTANMAGIVTEAVGNRYVIQIVDGSSEKISSAVAAARSARGVTNVRPVPEEEIRQTLERWLGAGGVGDLPVPALINLDLAPGVEQAEVARRISQAVPGARLVSEQMALQPILRSLRALQWLALSLVLLIGMATAAAVVLAARGSLDTHRSTIEIMHGIGATDEQIASLFQRRIGLDALTGALVGGGFAAIVLFVLAGFASIAIDFAGRSPLAAGDLLLLAGIPFAAVALATVVARLAVLASLRKVV